MKLSEKVKIYLYKRQKDYWHTFDKESEAVKYVLEDLKKFCRAEETCFHKDDRLHAVLEGRREVYLRIKKHLKLKPDELVEYYTTKGISNE